MEIDLTDLSLDMNLILSKEFIMISGVVCNEFQIQPSYAIILAGSPAKIYLKLIHVAYCYNRCVINSFKIILILI